VPCSSTLGQRATHFLAAAATPASRGYELKLPFSATLWRRDSLSFVAPAAFDPEKTMRDRPNPK